MSLDYDLFSPSLIMQKGFIWEKIITSAVMTSQRKQAVCLQQMSSIINLSGYI